MNLIVDRYILNFNNIKDLCEHNLSYTSLLDELDKDVSVSENLIIFSRYLLHNELINGVYEVIEHENSEATLKIITIGVPQQILQIINQSLNQPITDYEYPVLEIPVLRRVYSERKPIYFKKVPDLLSAFIPSLKSQTYVKNILNQLGVTDVGVAPIFLRNKQKMYILSVLGPLSDKQRLLIKNSVADFETFFN